MQPQTQERILACMRANPDHPFTCEEVAAASGLSVVTVRRYMGHMAREGQLMGDMNYSTGGRPCLVYRLVT